MIKSKAVWVNLKTGRTAYLHIGTKGVLPFVAIGDGTIPFSDVSALQAWLVLNGYAPKEAVRGSAGR